MAGNVDHPTPDECGKDRKPEQDGDGKPAEECREKPDPAARWKRLVLYGIDLERTAHGPRRGSERPLGWLSSRVPDVAPFLQEIWATPRQWKPSTRGAPPR